MWRESRHRPTDHDAGEPEQRARPLRDGVK
jgi:hypothetical protein